MLSMAEPITRTNAFVANGIDEVLDRSESDDEVTVEGVDAEE